MSERDIPMTPPCPKGPYGLHVWDRADGGFGIIVGVSRCRFCDELSRPEHFTVQRMSAPPGP